MKLNRIFSHKEIPALENLRVVVAYKVDIDGKLRILVINRVEVYDGFCQRWHNATDAYGACELQHELASIRELVAEKIMDGLEPFSPVKDDNEERSISEEVRDYFNEDV